MNNTAKVRPMSRVSCALAVAAIVAATSSSIAADMYGGNRTAPAYGNNGYQDQSAPNSAWNGAYAGGSLGYGWGNNGLNGTHIGIYGGVNATVGSNVVVGGEADLNIAGQRQAGVLNGQLKESSSTWNGSLRARVGVAFDRVMPYATAGIALADDTVKYGNSTDSTTKVGYAIGGGIEGKVVDRITVKGEYIREGFQSTTHSINGTEIRQAPSTSIIRTGVAYHF